ncbi:MAG: SEC-C domain-containing protein [Fibrobacter sp.]|uniref:YecA family protein n=1 Tax=Fibrobacter sp. TaxID=35828 RepID=UPI0025BA6AF2|nr:SEC-C domain-containing protein [Fibrobacter sp.]MBQ9226002.1 SEC-C domain-containing protein [Fibrobacter sp.]
MNAATYINDFYEAIKTHNDFFPEDTLDLNLYKKITEEPVTERDVDYVSELANRYIYKVISVCDKTIGEMGYTSTCHFMADIHRRALIENGIKPEDISLTIGEVHLDDKPMYDTSKSFIKQILDEGPESTLELKLHCWLTFKNRYIIDPSIQFNLVKRQVFKRTDLCENNLVYALGEDYSSARYTWSMRDGSEKSVEVNEMLRYEPILVDNDFYFRVQETPLEYLELCKEFKHLDAKARSNIEKAKSNMLRKLSDLKAMYSLYQQEKKHRDVGRNDPCWCGSGLKFKKCHGKN